MKIVGKTEALSVGDRIVVGVTHQVKIGHEDSWIKVELNSDVRPDETSDQAVDRVVDYVNVKALEVVMKTVQEVRNLG